MSAGLGKTFLYIYPLSTTVTVSSEVLKAAAQVLTKTKKVDLITPVLYTGFLSVKELIFKILLLVYKALKYMLIFCYL